MASIITTASSTDRGTSQETRLRIGFRLAYARLYHARRHQEAQFITTAFATLLDGTKDELLATATRDARLWSGLGESCREKKASENVWVSVLHERGGCAMHPVSGVGQGDSGKGSEMFG